MDQLEHLKRQASRLSDFLGRNHRVSLKRASALEAVAHMHGARNWQTLQASSNLSEPVGEQQVAPTRSNVSWLKQRGMDERHAFVSGTAKHQLAWFARALGDHLDAQLPGCFLAVPDSWADALVDAGAKRWTLGRAIDRQLLTFATASDMAEDSVLQSVCSSLAALPGVQRHPPAPYSIALMDSAKTERFAHQASALYMQGRSVRVQLLVASTPLEAGDMATSRAKHNVFTHVSMGLTEDAKARLLAAAAVGEECHFNGDGSVKVLAPSRHQI